MRLKELTVAGFRGFKLAQTIPLDADIVLIYGPNGSGKSSIVEALEWLLLGDISRHERAQSRSEYRGSLRNVHCSQHEPTFVEAKTVIQGRELVIRREYQSAQRSTVLVDENEIDDLSAVGVAVERPTRPILSQGEIRSFVDTEQAERQKEIAHILGLDVLGEFRQSLMNLENNMNRDTMISQAIRLRDARSQDLRQYEELSSLSDMVEASLFEYRAFLDRLYSCVRDICGVVVGSLDQYREALTAERNRIIQSSPALSRLNELAIPGDVIPTSKILEALQGIVKICDPLKSIAAQMIEMRQARFLKDGLELISDSTCPFCLQQTMSEARKSEICAHLQVHEEGLKLEEQLRTDLETVSSRWWKVTQDLDRKVGIRTEVRAALEQALELLGKTSDTDALNKFHETKLPELQAQVDTVNKEVEHLKQSCTNLLDHRPDLSISELISLAKKVHLGIEAVCVKAYSEITELATLKSRILSKAPGLSPQSEGKVRMVIALESLIENSGYVRLAGTYDSMILRLENLKSRVEEFERSKMEEMLSDLSAEICHYYDKLNPGEPIRFTRLAVAGPGRRQVRIEGESYSRDMNPVSCFSEAHVNCLGLSLYFCQRVGRNVQCEFFVLDDPVQSMDEQHADRLVDVLREVSQEKQLIVLTHQKALCDLLDDVFRDRKYVKYNCGPYSKDGPQIESGVESIEKNLQLAKTFSRGNKDDRINKSAASLRKAMEAIVKELLVDKCGVAAASLRTQRVKLGRRLTQLERSGFNRDDVVSMRTILPIVDQPHHDDPNWDIPPQRIDRAVEIFDSLCRKYSIGPYRVARKVVGRVTNYLPKVGVAVVEVNESFSIKDNLLIEGATTCTQFVVESMEVNREKIDTAQPGAIVGIRVPDKVRPNDLVYKTD